MAAQRSEYHPEDAAREPTGHRCIEALSLKQSDSHRSDDDGDRAEGDGDPTPAPGSVPILQIRKSERSCDQIRTAEDADERLKDHQQEIADRKVDEAGSEKGEGKDNGQSVP